MKLILSLTAVLTLVANLALAIPPSVHARDSNCPQNGGHALRFHRADKDKVDYFYSTDVQQINEMVSDQGYKRNGAVGAIFPTQEPGTIPLYRLYNAHLIDHVYTSSNSDKKVLLNQGYHAEGKGGVAGYVLRSNSCKLSGYGVVPLYRFSSSNETAHLLTIDINEHPAGYVADHIVGYVVVQG